MFFLFVVARCFSICVLLFVCVCVRGGLLLLCVVTIRVVCCLVFVVIECCLLFEFDTVSRCCSCLLSLLWLCAVC